MSAGEQAVVHAAGPPAPGNIRNQVNAEVSLDRPKRSLSDILASGARLPGRHGRGPEAREPALRRTRRCATAPTPGNTPIIQRRQQGFLDQLF